MGAGGGHLSALDRPRLLQRPLGRHHAGTNQRRVDLRVGVGLPAVLDPDHRGQDGPQAGIVVQVERLIDAEPARLGYAVRPNGAYHQWRKGATQEVVGRTW
jgi:hypothetical protein